MATIAVGDYGICWEFVRVICLYSNLYTYKASDCKHTIISLHCATSKSSLWNMGYVARGGVFECPRIYRTNVYVSTCIYMYLEVSNMYMYSVHVHNDVTCMYFKVYGTCLVLSVVRL